MARAARAALDESASAAADDPPPDADPLARWFTAFRRAQRLAVDPHRLPGHLTHLACNRLGVRLDQEATLRGLAALARAEMAEAAETALDEPAARS